MKRLLSLVFGVLLATAAPASADDILFDTNGGTAGGVVTIDQFDPKVGNSLTLGVDAVQGDTGTVLFQANLGTANLDGATQFVSCFLGSTCFTFTVAVDVVVTSVIGNTITLGLDPALDADNAFYMYANTLQGNDLTGTCFAATACGGTLILSGTFTDFTASFTLSPVALEPLDQFGDNNYPAVSTISGLGAFTGDILVLSALDAWFPNLVDGSSFFIASSEQKLPYEQGDPSACFSSNGLLNCDQAGVAILGPVNGTNGNTMLQTDANVSFINEAVVPEPASLLLLGSGLLGAAAARRRSRKK